MPVTRWRGTAPFIQQVNTLTVDGLPAPGQVYTVTLGGRTECSIARPGDTNDRIAARLQTQLAASLAPAFQDVIWTVHAHVITGTARTAGNPFSNTSLATGTGTLLTTTTTPNSRPTNCGTPANWSNGMVLATDDEAELEPPDDDNDEDDDGPELIIDA